MSSLVIGEQVRIPGWVVDLDSFRRWVCSDEFPEHGWFSHLHGDLWVDLSMETAVHNQIKSEIARVLGNLTKARHLGRYFGDRMLLTNPQAGLATEPDGMFLSHAALDAGKVNLFSGDETLEVFGTPNMVLEVVSKTSVPKDTVVLRDLYWQAGVAEYWLVDSRSEKPALDIWRRGSRKYLSTSKQAGWVKSKVFSSAFRLQRQPGAHDLSEYSLAVR